MNELIHAAAAGISYAVFCADADFSHVPLTIKYHGNTVVLSFSLCRCVCMLINPTLLSINYHICINSICHILM